MTTAETAFSYRPLYVQVKDSLVRRLIDGAWQPGQLIPSEIDLAREIGVSQGTVRKALDAMTGENLLVRRQGRGTFVAEPEESRILFQFFRFVQDSGERSFPASNVISHGREAADPARAALLGVGGGDMLFRIERIRTVAARPLIAETIWLPASRVSGFDALAGIPNNVYRLYSQRWGITIARASERLKAIPASKTDAVRLGIETGAPLLEIVRVAFDLENKPVELRVSRCLTDGIHYASDLR
ncbi:MAG: GntR family transcriptional regulator [Rhizobiaceae bacterium]